MPSTFVRNIRRTLKPFRDALLSRWCERRASQRLVTPTSGRPHGLPGELIVSLTSYPARFETLHLTLACLLDQTVAADRTVLWIAKQDSGEIPDSVRQLEQRGLEIRFCEDLRSFKKLVPTLEAFPEAFVATADDDLYFPRNWLELLVEGARSSPGVIVYHRGHRMRREETGQLAPYLDWELDVQDQKARMPSVDVMPTGGAGALYPPAALDIRVTDPNLFERLCPHGDDLWFYWCARLVGTPHKKVGGKMRLICWRESQENALWNENEAGRNDAMLAALQEQLGNPV